MLAKREAELAGAEQRIEALEEDLTQKTNMLKGISQVGSGWAWCLRGGVGRWLGWRGTGAGVWALPGHLWA